MQLEQLDYDLPEDLIAQAPPELRDGARLLVMQRGGGDIEDGRVARLVDYLPGNSLVVLNDTKVIPARLHGHKKTGGKVELLLVEQLEEKVGVQRWRVMGRASKGLRAGMEISFAGGLEAVVDATLGNGFAEVSLAAETGVKAAVNAVGEMPLPPYIRRSAGVEDRERYQTVFAAREGAVAAPTAGLHLTEAMLEEMSNAGHETARVTLHVGPGTFLPVKVSSLDGHEMHEERYAIQEDAAHQINEARREGRPIVAVGTTVVRTLESSAGPEGIVAGQERTRLFIRPPYEFQAVDGLLTNFHLPRSTLLALVMAFGGEDPVRRAYSHAVDARYRFFSYGDAMFLRGDKP